MPNISEGCTKAIQAGGGNLDVIYRPTFADAGAMAEMQYLNASRPPAKAGMHRPPAATAGPPSFLNDRQGNSRVTAAPRIRRQ